MHSRIPSEIRSQVSRRPAMGWATRITAVLTAAAAGVTALPLAAAPATAASKRDPIIFGASAGTRYEVAYNEKLAGRRIIGYRSYRSWDESLLGQDGRWARATGRIPFVSVAARTRRGARIPYSAIAYGHGHGPVIRNVVRLAKEARAHRARIWFVFQHEPEETRSLGSPAQYAAAWRRIYRAFQYHKAYNVRFVFTMTAYGYARTDGLRAARFYPGDGYVHAIGADGYNWGHCRGTKQWRPFSEIFEAHRRFGRHHPGKKLMILEWGSVEDRRTPGLKARWIKNMTTTLKRPEWSQYKAVVSWHGRHFSNEPQCRFGWLTSRAALRAWSQQARDAAFRGKRL